MKRILIGLLFITIVQYSLVYIVGITTHWIIDVIIGLAAVAVSDLFKKK